MPQYIVLKPISPAQGPVIEPAPEPTANDPAPQLVLIDDSVLSGETDDERAANAERLIAMGVIAVYEAPAAAPEAEPAADQPVVVRRVARKPEE